MKLRVKLFAVARQRVASEAIEVELSEPASIGNLRGAIAEQFPPLADLLVHVRFAVNSDYASDATIIPVRAEIALIPPVSGG